MSPASRCKSPLSVPSIQNYNEELALCEELSIYRTISKIFAMQKVFMTSHLAVSLSTALWIPTAIAPSEPTNGSIPSPA